MNTTISTHSMSDKPLVVVGSGLAGYTFIREFRKVDREKRILLVTADDGHSYSKPMLSTGFAKGKGADELSIADAGKMAVQLDVEIRTHTWVTAIEPASNSLHLGFERNASTSGEVVEFCELVLALGADVVRPALTGSAASDVLSINSLADYRRFRERLDEVAQTYRERGLADQKLSIAILGSGLIGCEFANDLLASGDAQFSVQVISPDERPLQRVLPEQVSKALAKGLADAGTHFHWGRTVQSIDHAGSSESQTGPAYSLTLAPVGSGEANLISADVVLSATGLRPHTELANAAGLKINRGIVVDRQLRSSAQNIFALGDCAEVDGHLLLYVQPLMQCARLLAANLAGGGSQTNEISYQAMPVIVKTTVCPLVISPPPEGLSGEWSVPEAETIDVKALFHDGEGQLRGFALSGRYVIEKQTLLKDLPPLHA